MDYLTKCILGTSIMSLIAVMGYFFTPKKRSTFGYKTHMSLKNDDTWNYANNLAKKYFVFIVILLVVLQILLFNYLEDDYNAYRYFNFTFVGLSILIIPFVEIALYLKFDNDGKPKKNKESD